MQRLAELSVRRPILAMVLILTLVFLGVLIRGVHDVGLRARPGDGRAHGGDRLPRTTDCDRDELGNPQRDPRRRRRARRGALPRRRLYRPTGA